MGFTDLAAEAGLSALNSWLTTRSYVVGYTPSQGDVTIYKAISSAPDSAKYPNAARWYKNIHSYETDFETLPGEQSTDISQYGPEVVENTVNPAAAPEKVEEEDDDDEVDLFGSDDEDEDKEKEALAAKRLEEYRAKKALKPKTIAKSVVTLDVKPWDDETNMDELVANVKAIEKDGLVWGAHTLVAVGYGIKKLQINLVVEDEKISLDELQQQIEEDEDHVQSTDIAAMQKL
ncbi:elongation factor EF-1 beta subunit [Tricharina praecox]|uniref:elongation factor EF-1 beta subunit n=1 Tax=Tricharina praecox TaxID=43433 RepID=UPI0022204495|nr:elongation factor EF-1 beta subunit [Tricharina praecox]KAI5851993.1 elongation factor EF-1 beta subunit [Tricharina praecox]